MLSASYIVASLFVVAASGQTPRFLSPVLFEPSLDSGWCLTAVSRANGSQVVVRPCTGDLTQQWTFDGGAVKYFNNTSCLDVKDGVDADGTRLQIWKCFPENTNQKFNYTPNKTLTWRTNQTKCVDLTGTKVANWNPAVIWTCGDRDHDKSQVWNAGYYAGNLPKKSQEGQTGTNNCGTASSPDSQCQTAWINDERDFCLWGLPSSSGTNGTLQNAVAYCLQDGHGARLIANDTLQNVKFTNTSTYVQVTGSGDLTRLNIPAGNNGTVFGPRGVDGKGAPIGGLVYGNTIRRGLQYHEWTAVSSDKAFCFRACTGPNAVNDCACCGS